MWRSRIASVINVCTRVYVRLIVIVGVPRGRESVQYSLLGSFVGLKVVGFP